MHVCFRCFDSSKQIAGALSVVAATSKGLCIRRRQPDLAVTSVPGVQMLREY
jgi:hypothetical protein